MTRIEKILVRARDTLSDPNAERWTDAQLLRLVDEAQTVIAHKGKLLRAKTDIPLIIGQALYTLPEDIHKIIRVLDSNQTAVKLVSHEWADKHLDEAWETDVGNPVQYIIFDKTNTGTIKVYPIPEAGDTAYVTTVAASAQVWNPVEFNTSYGIMVDSGYTGDTFSGYYGVVTDIDYISPFFTDPSSCIGYTVTDDGVLNSEYGVLVNLEDGLYTFTDYDPTYGITVGVDGYTLVGTYGIVADFSDDYLNIWSTGVYGLLVNFIDESIGMTLYYLKKPTEITAVDQDLEISSVFDRAIKFYVTAMALRDDKDTQNRAMGNEELQLFTADLTEALRDGEQDFTATRTQYDATYIGAFD